MGLFAVLNRLIRGKLIVHEPLTPVLELDCDASKEDY